MGDKALSGTIFVVMFILAIFSLFFPKIFATIMLAGIFYWIFFFSEWELDFYDISTEDTVHTSLWDIICTKKVPAKYPVEKLRQRVEELQLLWEVEEDTEFFDDECGYVLVVNNMDILRRGNGEVGGAIIHATWHALEEGDVPCEETEASTITVKIGKYQTEKLIKNLEGEK